MSVFTNKLENKKEFTMSVFTNKRENKKRIYYVSIYKQARK